MTRALLTLPRDSFDRLIVLEEQPGYLDYLKVTKPYSSPAHIRSISSLMTAGPDILPVLRSPWKKSMTGSKYSLIMDTVGTHIPCWTSKGG